MNKYDFIKVGSTVYWYDPEGISNGEYKVISIPEEGIEDDSIILIASKYSEAEVFPTELRPV
jgi:uncharacterized protein YcfL